ncbi:unnamed protein product [Oppiella nova]|uniref:Uncharacterized protein n=1 Tax=Oppiella nova TaxID=334625 RepID=A0A7R9QDB8_9ACAR|nr:unnamed protein product [Oppiella nova]CAG2163614.1 unnamed protein product [Oppiella nova]
MYGSGARRGPTGRSPYDTSMSFRTPLNPFNQSNQSLDQSFNKSYLKSFNVLGDTSLNSSHHQLSQSVLISQTSHHTLKPYTSLLPVLVIEAISSDGMSHTIC